MILTHIIPEQEMIFCAPGIPGTYGPVQGAACVHAEEQLGSINVEELTHHAFTIALYTWLNKCKLKQGFRQLYDTVPFEYLQDCRMQEAHSLLHSGTMSLGQIASGSRI